MLTNGLKPKLLLSLWLAPITNCFAVLTPMGILTNSSTAAEHFVNLKKEISNQIRDNDGLDDGLIELKLNHNFMHKSRIESSAGRIDGQHASGTPCLDTDQNDASNLREQVDKLKRLNKQLYQFQLQKVYRS